MNACLEKRASIRVLRVEEHKGMWWEPFLMLGIKEGEVRRKRGGGGGGGGGLCHSNPYENHH